MDEALTHFFSNHVPGVVDGLLASLILWLAAKLLAGTKRIHQIMNENPDQTIVIIENAIRHLASENKERADLVAPFISTRTPQQMAALESLVKNERRFRKWRAYIRFYSSFFPSMIVFGVFMTWMVSHKHDLSVWLQIETFALFGMVLLMFMFGFAEPAEWEFFGPAGTGPISRWLPKSKRKPKHLTFRAKVTLFILIWSFAMISVITLYVFAEPYYRLMDRIMPAPH